jgi:hypothetical protein
MRWTPRLVVILALSAALLCVATNVPRSYVAAVVEFSPSFPDFGHDYTRAEAVSFMQINLKRLDRFASEAASQGAQIIVFPEYGIQADEPLSNWTRFPGAGSILPFTEAIPGNYMLAFDRVSISRKGCVLQDGALMFSVSSFSLC